MIHSNRERHWSGNLNYSLRWRVHFQIGVSYWEKSVALLTVLSSLENASLVHYNSLKCRVISLDLTGSLWIFLSEGKCYDDTLQSQFYYPAMESFILCSPDLFVYSDCQTGAAHDKKLPVVNQILKCLQIGLPNNINYILSLTRLLRPTNGLPSCLIRNMMCLSRLWKRYFRKIRLLKAI